MKFSDRPISRPDQDAFGRAKFASFLATAIDNLPVSTVAKDGYIIAVHGKWGAGKTSTVELAIRYLRHIEMERASHIALPPNRDSNPRTRDELEVMARTFEQIEGRILSIENQNKDPTRWEPSSRFKEFLKWLGSEESARVADYYWQLKVYVDKNPRTLVVRFSPWIFSGRVELASALLSELARTLGQRLGPDVRAAFGQVLVLQL